MNGTEKTMSLLVALIPFKKVVGVGIVAGEDGLNVDKTSPQDGYIDSVSSGLGFMGQTLTAVPIWRIPMP